MHFFPVKNISVVAVTLDARFILVTLARFAHADGISLQTNS